MLVVLCAFALGYEHGRGDPRPTKINSIAVPQSSLDETGTIEIIRNPSEGVSGLGVPTRLLSVARDTESPVVVGEQGPNPIWRVRHCANGHTTTYTVEQLVKNP